MRKVTTILIGSVWLVNGLICKVLNLVPRHQEIVSQILSQDYALFLTKSIGTLEILMAIWIMSGYRVRLNAFTQISIIISMNVIEFNLTPNLLLWGKFNLIFAIGICAIIYTWGFIIHPTIIKPTAND